MFSHPETGSDQPIGSDRESGRDTKPLLPSKMKRLFSSYGRTSCVGSELANRL